MGVILKMKTVPCGIPANQPQTPSLRQTTRVQGVGHIFEPTSSAQQLKSSVINQKTHLYEPQSILIYIWQLCSSKAPSGASTLFRTSGSNILVRDIRNALMMHSEHCLSAALPHSSTPRLRECSFIILKLVIFRSLGKVWNKTLPDICGRCQLSLYNFIDQVLYLNAPTKNANRDGLLVVPLDFGEPTPPPPISLDYKGRLMACSSIPNCTGSSIGPRQLMASPISELPHSNFGEVLP